MFDRVLELEFDLEHLSVPWDEVTAEEVKALQILKEERNKAHSERMEEEAKNRGV